MNKYQIMKLFYIVAKYNTAITRITQELKDDYKDKVISINKIIDNGFNVDDTRIFLDIQEYINYMYEQGISIETLIKFYNRFFNYPNVDENLLLQKIEELV